MKSRFTIIICTYNPDWEIFERVLESIAVFRQKELISEVIIVDNRCSIPLNESQVQSSLENIDYRIIREEKPGLVNARIAGIKASRTEWIIFIDDDNEPAANYLQKLDKIIIFYPKVGIWGPGNVFVEFIGQVTKRQADLFKPYFQELHIIDTYYSSEFPYKNTLPYGTGMCARRDILNKYVQLIETGKLSMVGRTGSNLASGEDIQIDFTALVNGIPIGRHPDLSVKHLISSRKVTLTYIKRLIYGCDAGALKAYLDFFPQKKQEHDKLPSHASFFYRIAKDFASLRKHKSRDLLILSWTRTLANFMLTYNGLEIKPPLYLLLFKRMLGV